LLKRLLFTDLKVWFFVVVETKMKEKFIIASAFFPVVIDNNFENVEKLTKLSGKTEI
jgi:hypothetical protein